MKKDFFLPSSDRRTDCPLSQPGAAEPEDVAAGLGDPLLEAGLDLVVGEEGDVARMRHLKMNNVDRKA